MEHKINNIFVEKSICYNIDTLKDYLENKLPSNEKRKLELHIADCEFCSDTLEGLSLMQNSSKLPIIISEINTNIENRIKRNNDLTKNRIKPNIISINSRIKRSLSIAASLILLVGLGFMLKFYFNDANNQMADNTSVKSEIEKNDFNETYVDNKKEVLEEKKSENIEKSVKTITKNKKVLKINTKKGGKNTFSSKPKANSNKNTEKFDNKVNTEVNKDITENSEETESDEAISNPIIANTNNKNIATVNSSVENKAVATSSINFNKSTQVKDKPQKEKRVFAATSRSAFRAKKQSTDKNIALENFRKRKYDIAIKGFEKILAKNKADEEALFYSGASLYEMKKFASALSRMEQVMKKNNQYSEDAEWYIALIYEGQNNTDSAIQTLNRIKLRNGKFTKQAESKLEELQN